MMNSTFSILQKLQTDYCSSAQTICDTQVCVFCPFHDRIKNGERDERLIFNLILMIFYHNSLSALYKVSQQT